MDRRKKALMDHAEEMFELLKTIENRNPERSYASGGTRLKVVLEKVREAMKEPPVTLSKIVNCARCGGRHDGPLVAQKLDRPVVVDSTWTTDAPFATHWFPCPTNGQPILVLVEGDMSITGQRLTAEEETA